LLLLYYAVLYTILQNFKDIRMMTSHYHLQESSHQKLIYSGQLLNDSLQLKDILRQCDGIEDQAYTVHLVCTPQKICAAKLTLDQNRSAERNVDAALSEIII